jgi:hypothetical protein
VRKTGMRVACVPCGDAKNSAAIRPIATANIARRIADKDRNVAPRPRKIPVELRS